ncbi:HK97-gp10 family putative phage morphogenesis protein [Streptomyces sp. WMMC897]|uniref:HK97-gp10 family putative phage morphogenesis protein n=1 Tax=Streptomyces sp. WMMC897 TaxID=3014782 RepID=UPI0022B69FEE|nr:HK97-gp10 family putative phage morphogenesis protein [Streptomyces sp. WMMC897]MCZ7414315.1 HK97 gp10 family phage protein [Streptomyces sp. WMMC897]
MPRRGVTVQITGRQRLMRRLEELEPELREALQDAVKESAENVAADTRRGVRVDTGNLRAKVAIRYEDDGLVADVGWHEDPEYYARYHELGTRRFPAQPALAPALERERAVATRRLSAAVRSVLR